ncbi:MAG: phosphoribosyltransferase [Betaproteobacteria bacterium]|nr:phosphoribosyltransferase [Betaproteobacteria bacterium]
MSGTRDEGGARSAQRTVLYDTKQLDAVIGAMTRRAGALLADAPRVTVVGILRRGAPLADRVATGLRRDVGTAPVERLDLEITRYADDLTLLYPETRFVENPAHAGLDLAGAHVLVVDDVVYTGHSLLRAVQYLSGNKPSVLRTAVLVDRSTGKLPVPVDIAGARLAVAESDIVECHVPPYDPDWGIVLVGRRHDARAARPNRPDAG